MVLITLYCYLGTPIGCFQVVLGPWPTPLSSADPKMPYRSDWNQLWFKLEVASGNFHRTFWCLWRPTEKFMCPIWLRSGLWWFPRRHCSTTALRLSIAHWFTTHCTLACDPQSEKCWVRLFIINPQRMFLLDDQAKFGVIPSFLLFMPPPYLIRAISTVMISITLPPASNTTSIGTGKLTFRARSGLWRQKEHTVGELEGVAKGLPIVSFRTKCYCLSPLKALERHLAAPFLIHIPYLFHYNYLNYLNFLTSTILTSM